MTGADGRWELQGYTREQVMAFSRRRQDIEEALARRGLSGAAAAQNIAHQSRLSKITAAKTSFARNGEAERANTESISNDGT